MKLSGTSDYCASISVDILWSKGPGVVGFRGFDHQFDHENVRFDCRGTWTLRVLS